MLRVYIRNFKRDSAYNFKFRRAKLQRVFDCWRLIPAEASEPYPQVIAQQNSLAKTLRAVNLLGKSFNAFKLYIHFTR